MLAYQHHRHGMRTVVSYLQYTGHASRKMHFPISSAVIAWLEHHPEQGAIRVEVLRRERTIVDVRDLNRALM